MPLIVTGEIGDGCALASMTDFVSEIAPARRYDPVNPCDIGAVSPPNEPPPALFRSSEADILGLLLVPESMLPMTSHQRFYQWPDVGPVRLADGKWGVSKPPTEVPVGQADWPTAPVTLVPIYATERRSLGPALDTETALPQRGNSLREFWTFYRTMPWVPTAFIRPMPFEGDTRKFYIRGVTRNAAGAALGGVTLRCILSSLFLAGLPTSPIFAELVSDGSGNYEFGVSPHLGYEVHAYHEGTNVGGITVDDLQADVTVDIYCTQPGVAPGGGGGNTYSRSRVVNK